MGGWVGYDEYKGGEAPQREAKPHSANAKPAPTAQPKAPKGNLRKPYFHS